jgi:hypothetical protein
MFSPVPPARVDSKNTSIVVSIVNSSMMPWGGERGRESGRDEVEEEVRWGEVG